MNIMIKRTIVIPGYIGPIKHFQLGAREELKYLKKMSIDKHYNAENTRSIALAKELLERKEIIAIPTDTLYGLAGLVQDNDSINKLYEIKKRDMTKPLSISVCDLSEVKLWGITDELPENLLNDLLPGPVTVILKRTPELNPALNPNTDTVGIRVPGSKFIRTVAEVAGPLALTSANESNKPSTLHPDEFKELWPSLGGIFYDRNRNLKLLSRKGSTIIDLTVPGSYKVVRHGCGFKYVIDVLRKYNMAKIGKTTKIALDDAC